ncbi:MAG: hypothetical protein C4530_03585 [Desulfobacteraceae bacterium]|nr:MAG: hypothetical protein C4530_03585 [Desulfobacteraceae bacterium]
MAETASRPKAIIIICLLGFTGLFFLIIGMISSQEQVISEKFVYPVYALAACQAFGLAGLWMMKKWALYLYIGVLVLNQILSIISGSFAFLPAAFAAVLILVLLAHAEFFESPKTGDAAPDHQICKEVAVQPGPVEPLNIKESSRVAAEDSKNGRIAIGFSRSISGLRKKASSIRPVVGGTRGNEDAARLDVSGITTAVKSTLMYPGFLTFLGIGSLLCAITAYKNYMGFGEALLASLVFIITWGILFFILPAILRLLLGLLAIGLIIGCFFMIQSHTDNALTSVIVTGIGAFIFLILVGILLYAAFLVPGIFLGYITYQVCGETPFGAFLGIVVFMVVSGVLYFFIRYVIPFLTAFGWAMFSGLLANKVAVYVFLGRFVFEKRYGQFSYQSLYRIADTLIGNLVLTLKPPTLLGIWIFTASVLLAGFAAYRYCLTIYTFSLVTSGD